MSDYTELKRLAEAFPADLDWDSNTEPFFNGPSGESLGGGPTGFYCVYGPAFEIDDEQYDGPTYVESCKVDFAKFMVAAREGVLALIKDIESHKRMLLAAACDLGAIGEALGAEMDDDGSELEGIATELRKDAERLQSATAFVQKLCDSAGKQPSVAAGYLHDILSAMGQGEQS